MYIDPISVFLSSPSDVQAERERAKKACQELQVEPATRELFRLDAYAFEDRVPPVVGEQPQMTVDKFMLQPDDADIMVCIFWTRMGSEFVDKTGRHWESGTAYEFETALQRYKRTGKRPVVLLYRCVRETPATADANQVAAVERFFSRMHDPASGVKGIYHHRSFRGADEFVESLKRDLREILKTFGVRESAESTKPLTPLDALSARAQTMWVEGVLKPSLEGRPPIPMPLTVPPGPHLPGGLPKGSYTGIWLKSLFRESGRRLVLTARAGGGKTIALMQLLHHLLQDRRIDSGVAGGGPVPVVFDATSWKDGQPVKSWFLQELDRLYGVRLKTAREFIDNKNLIYFIDGIDRIGMRSQSATDAVADDPAMAQRWAERFAEFLREGTWSQAQQAPVILCCRDDGLPRFTDLFAEGKFQTVIINAPERANLLDVVRADPTVHGLAEKLEEFPQLAALAEVPLFLQMLMSVFRSGSTYRPLQNADEQQQTSELISSYVEMRLAADATHLKKDRFTIPQVRTWLTWLARNQNRSPFLIELMQPDMLAPAERRLYRLIAALLLSAAVTATAILPVPIGLGIDWGHHRGASTGLTVGLTAAAAIIAVSMLLLTPTFLWARGAWFGLWLSFAFSAVRGISVGGACPDGDLPCGWEPGLRAALFTWLSSAPVFMVFGHYVKYSIDSIQPLSNWNVDLKRGQIGVVIGALVGAVFWLVYGPARGITFGTLAGLILTAILCLRQTGFDVPSQPNHGIVRSTWNALVLAMILLIVGPPVVALSYGYEFGARTGIENGVESLAIVVTALMFGGVPVLQHWSLRLVCAWRDRLPLRLIRFLNAMSELMLMQRVGGAYRFSHDLISGFFAGTKQSPR